METVDIIEAEQVDEEILQIAEQVEEGWFADESQIDWEEFWDRMEGTQLLNGSLISMGPSLDSPAIRKIKKHIRELRAQG